MTNKIWNGSGDVGTADDRVSSVSFPALSIASAALIASASLLALKAKQELHLRSYSKRAGLTNESTYETPSSVGARNKELSGSWIIANLSRSGKCYSSLNSLNLNPFLIHY